MYQVIIAIHVLLGLSVIGLVMMQQGKGADAGASFGTGSAGSVFGAQGAASFLSRTTAILATGFFITSLGLAIINGHKGSSTSIMNTPAAEDKPIIPPADKAPTSAEPEVVTPPPMPKVTPETKPIIETPAQTAPIVTPAKDAKIENIALPKTEEIKAVDNTDKKPAEASKSSSKKDVAHKKEKHAEKKHTKDTNHKKE